VFLNILAAHRDQNRVDVATSSKLTIGTGDQDDRVALASASNMTAIVLDVSEIAVARHRYRMCVLTLYPNCLCKGAYGLAKRVAWRLI
jgi:selenocysteine lyase/cysteine desulfurase